MDDTTSGRRFKLFLYFRYHNRLYHYKELAEKFNVCERTIIRDIDFLVKEGLVSKKTYRGRVDAERYGGFYITTK